MSNKIIIAREYFIHGLIMAASLFVVVALLYGVSSETLDGLIKASCLFGLLNGLIRAFIFWKKLQDVVQKVAMFHLMTNMGLIYLISIMFPDFYLKGLSAAFWTSVWISLLGLLIDHFFHARTITRAKNSSQIKQAQARVIKTISKK